MLLVVITTSTACKKNADAVPAVCETATVQYMGDPAADGLGWALLVQDSTTGHIEIAKNLPESYKVNGMRVDICYERTGDLYFCFCAAPFKMINIISIKMH